MTKKVKDSVKNANISNKETEGDSFFNNTSQIVLFCVLLASFLIMLGTATFTITKYYAKENASSAEVVKVTTSDNTLLIVNNGLLKEKITDDSFDKDELIIERINSIELSKNNNKSNNEKVNYSIKYKIYKNTIQNFADKGIVFVKFSYSYDGIKWNYINNVISTPDSTITPLMDNYYDITGYQTNLRIVTNTSIETENKEANKIFWRSETIFKKQDNIDISGIFESEFKIEYK